MKEINAYLNFDGNCREAMTLYGECFGAELQIMPFSGMPGEVPPGAIDRVMHARLSKGGVTLLMASDTMPGMPLQRGNDIWISIICESLEEIERLFAALAENGTVKMALHDAFWGARFGVLRDRFGVPWMFNFEYPKQG